VAGPLTATVAALRHDHGHQLGVLQAEVAALTDLARHERNAPVDWTSMNAADAAAQWVVLAAWVGEVFVPWYRITRNQLSDCWALHGDAVLELSWLRSCHVQSYLPSAHPHVTAEWHVRWKKAALDNIAAVIGDDLCRPGEHLVTEDESRARRSAAAHDNPPGYDPEVFPPSTQPPARMQLARREFWEAFYTQAVADDVARRPSADQPDSPADQPQSADGDPRADQEGPPRI